MLVAVKIVLKHFNDGEFMKKSILITTTLLMAQFSMALTNNVSEQFLNKSMDLLARAAPKIKLTGDVHKNERLTPMLTGIGTDKVRDMSLSCEMFPRKIAAKCILTLEYRPIGETSISYLVSLDKNKLPVSIMESRADVSRGD
jgi:hypothetical protein